MHRDSCNIGEYIDKVPKGAGFEMEGYWVWCGSAIQAEDGKYHLFASRWPKAYPFHPGWGLASEVVRAVSDTPEGPYTFCEVVLPARGAGYWDGRCTHNPVIQKHGDTYVLFYVGITYPYGDLDDPQALHHHSVEWLIARASKRIGIATAKHIEGPWIRADRPILEVRPGAFDDFFTSNPAPVTHEDGSCLLIYKTRTYKKPPYDTGEDLFSTMKLGAAWAPHYMGPYKRLSDTPLLDEKDGTVEDPFLWQTTTGYGMVAKDWSGTYTGEVGALVYASSTDGIKWDIQKGKTALGLEIQWSDGTKQKMGNIDRPFLLFNNDKEATHLFVATNDGEEAGFRTMSKSWNFSIPLKKG